mmetsp:Transcript_12017/g.29196  ORF Transcript_12017/g.29196 Transcript_12017/m.29196 type:complete len:285 (-) Transcript_12017:1014-1868(-)
MDLPPLARELARCDHRHARTPQGRPRGRRAGEADRRARGTQAPRAPPPPRLLRHRGADAQQGPGVQGGRRVQTVEVPPVPLPLPLELHLRRVVRGRRRPYLLPLHVLPHPHHLLLWLQRIPPRHGRHLNHRVVLGPVAVPMLHRRLRAAAPKPLPLRVCRPLWVGPQGGERRVRDRDGEGPAHVRPGRHREAHPPQVAAQEDRGGGDHGDDAQGGGRGQGRALEGLHRLCGRVVARPAATNIPRGRPPRPGHSRLPHHRCAEQQPQAVGASDSSDALLQTQGLV